MENTTIKKNIKFVLFSLFLLNLFLTPFVFSASPFSFSNTNITGLCTPYTNLSLNFYYVSNGSFYHSGDMIFTIVNSTFGFMMDSITLPYNSAASSIALDYDARLQSSLCNVNDNISGQITITDENNLVTISDILFNTNLEMDLNLPLDDSTITDNQTFFDWDFTFYQPYLSELKIATDSSMTSIVHQIMDINSQTYTLNDSQELGDGTYYWQISLTNLSSYPIVTSAINSFTLAAHGINIMNLLPLNTTWNSGPNVQLSFDTDSNGICRVGTSMGSDFASKNLMSTTGSTSHSTSVSLSTYNENRFYIQCNRTMDGAISTETEHTILLDNEPPQSSNATVTINNGDTYSLSPDISFNWSGFSDVTPGSGLAGYYYNTQNFQYSSIGTYTTNQQGTINGVSDGVVNVYVWGQDSLGNIGPSISDSIIVDLNPPTITEVSRTNLNRDYTGDFNFVVDISDSSPFNIPQISYRKWNNSATAFSNMVPVSATRYRYIISEESGENSWYNNTDERIYINITVTDMHGRQNNYSTSELIDLIVTVPTLDPIANLGTILQNETIKFNISGSDADGDFLTYGCHYSDTLSCSDLGITVERINNNIAGVTWSPSDLFSGNFTVSFWVSDQVSNITRSTSLEIINVNSPPALNTNFKDVYDGYVYDLFNLTVNATDPDGDELIFTTNHSSISIGMYSGEIYFYPSYEMRGEHSLNITISDPFGASITETIKIKIGYCGDGVCSDKETENVCGVDCTKETTTSSTAIILYPRNCLEQNMTVKVVELVPRGTCPTLGAIIDDKEVCNGLADKEIIFEEIINNTFEVISNHITDKEGYATLVPTSEALFRISLKNSDIKEVFTSKECITYDENESVDVRIITPDSGSFDSTVEKPSEVIKPSGDKKKLSLLTIILIIFLMPIILSFVGYFGAQRYYFFELKQIKNGKKNKSDFVAFIDEKILSNYFVYKKKLYFYIKDNEFLMYHLQKIKKNYIRLNKNLRIMRNELIEFLKKFGLFAPPKPVHLQIPFIKTENLEKDKSILLTLLSANKFVHKYLSNYKIYESLTENFIKPKKYHIAYLGKLCTSLNNKVTYYENERAPNDHDGLTYIKYAHKHGVEYKNYEWDIAELKKNINKKTAVIVELIATDPENSETFSQNFALVVGYDSRNIIIHDYLSNLPKRKIKNNLFMIAWKNANYRMLKIKYGKKK